MGERTDMTNSKDLCKMAISALEDKKAEDVSIIDISEVSVIADYFIIKKRKYNEIEKAEFKNINWIAIVAFIIGFLVSNIINVGVIAINALVATIISYIVGTKLFDK